LIDAGGKWKKKVHIKLLPWALFDGEKYHYNDTNKKGLVNSTFQGELLFPSIFVLLFFRKSLAGVST